jgi:hypothetical protein
MNVKILKVETKDWMAATIREAQKQELPSIQTGWDFNFGKRLTELSYATAYVLVTQETPSIVEGALIFQMQGKVVPYMAFLETAPHNRSAPKKYKYVAGCLIAFACKQSFIRGKGDNSGWLTFDVSEEDSANQVRLMAHYSKAFRAKRFTETTMLIEPEDGRKLIEEYLERNA